MHKTPEFPDLLKLIEERSSAFRAAIQSAPDLDVQVPTCPEWTLLDLARHLGGGQRRWAAIVTAGPDGGAPAKSSSQIGEAAPRERDALLAWLSESTQQLVDALHEVGPDRGCWTWWGDTESPETSGAVARHQVQEATVHTYDAQLAAGSAQPLPDEVAVDGVEEFNTTCGTTTVPWPHDAAIVDVHATEGPSWRVTLSADGSSVSRLAESGTTDTADDVAFASVRGTASDLVLAFYDRIPFDSLERGGDLRVLDQLRGWDMEP